MKRRKIVNFKQIQNRMKKIFFILVVLVFAGCTSKQTSQPLPGSFKYLSYYWNNSKDSVGLSLEHYMDIGRDGNYSLILRVNPDSTGYYYGFVGNSTYDLLKQFVADTTSYNESYIPADTAARTLRNKFDYTDSAGNKKITFTSQNSPEEITQIQSKLDSIINAPGKKRSQVFNIDTYLKKLIAEDSSLQLAPQQR